jgi:NAD(P)-dependent dehydrogenase (short-subunit alcohol dehydrogenase family)
MRGVALVTGGNRGIGLAVARQLAERGYEVWVGGRDACAAERAAGELSRGGGMPVRGVRLDVTDQGSVDTAVAEIGRESRRLDALVNNAGASFDRGQRTSEADMERVRATLEVNLLGAWRVAVACAPLLRESGHGRVVNVSSGLGSLATMRAAWAPAYQVSKTGLNGLTRALALDLAPEGVLVNSVCPGAVRTGLGGPMATRSAEEGAAGIVWAAMLPDGGPTGGFFRDGEPIPW